MIVKVNFGGGARRRIAQLQAAGGSLGDTFRAIALDMLRASTNNFRAQGQRDEATHLWPRLSESTIARRRKGQQASPQILQATGRLKNSLTPTHGTNYAAVGTNVEYAPKHQQGGRWGSRMRIRETVRIPAHLATRVVSRSHQGPKFTARAAKNQAWRVESLVGAKTPAQQRRSVASRRKRQLRKRFAAAAPRTFGPRLAAFAKRPKVKLARGYRRMKVPVRAHVQHLDYWLPARPFLVIHSFILAKAKQRLTLKLLGRKAA